MAQNAQVYDNGTYVEVIWDNGLQVLNAAYNTLSAHIVSNNNNIAIKHGEVLLFDTAYTDFFSPIAGSPQAMLLALQPLIFRGIGYTIPTVVGDTHVVALLSNIRNFLNDYLYIPLKNSHFSMKTFPEATALEEFGYSKVINISGSAILTTRGVQKVVSNPIVPFRTTFPLSDANLDVYSDHPGDDNSGGLGARQLRIEGVDIAGNIVGDTPFLSGTTPVTTLSQFYRVNKCEVIYHGGNLGNMGNIYLYHPNPGVVSGVIPAPTVPGEHGPSVMKSALHSVGSQMALIITDILINTNCNNNQTVKYRIYIRYWAHNTNQSHIEFTTKGYAVHNLKQVIGITQNADIFVTAELLSGTGPVDANITLMGTWISRQAEALTMPQDVNWFTTSPDPYPSPVPHVWSVNYNT